MLKRLFVVFLFLVAPALSYAATDFNSAAQLLYAAKNADIAQVQALVNAGADINYVDNTGLSIVCTAVMNKDTRATQILQMYGADASKCDQQINQYNARQPKSDSGGLFGGLSNAQGIALAAAGAAVVVGGVIWLAGSLGSGGDNNNSNNGGGGRGECRTGAACTCANGAAGTCSSAGICANCGDTTGTGTLAFNLPYGPAMPNAASETANYASNQNYYLGDGADAPAIIGENFDRMTNEYGQNYLLLMRGYSPLARGYLGGRTLRAETNAPIAIKNSSGESLYNFGTDPVQSGRPVAVALITANGVNAAPKPAGDISAGLNSLDDILLPWANVNGSSVTGPTNDMISSKYWNNEITKGAENNTSTDDSTAEDQSLISNFDLSGNGTAINNTNATAADDLLAKVVGGYTGGYAAGDFVGFMPNGQMAIFRTGGGTGAGGDIDYLNYTALSIAATMQSDISANGRSRVDIIANASIIDPLHARDAKTVDDILSWTADNREDAFKLYINSAYNNPAQNTSDDIGQIAGNFFNSVSSNLTRQQLVVFGSGAFKTDNMWSGVTLSAGFENAIPLINKNLEHLFMSAVAVGVDGGTNNAETISGYSPGGKIKLSQWQNIGADATANTTDDEFYKARKCGVGGKGKDGVDPWCFASAGLTDELAVASLAGAAGALKSAFSYMTNKQIFALMALTADGYLRKYEDGGAAYTAETLAAALKAKYELPGEYEESTLTGQAYLDAFAEVFGYGLVDLNRATQPTSKIYYYNGTDIVAGGGNGYWQRLASTKMSMSAAMGARTGSISAAFYDVLESLDGKMQLPRIFETKFALGGGANGLYMGDVLNDFIIQSTEQRAETVDLGNVSFSMNMSETQFADNMGGLDDMRFGFSGERFEMSAQYQRHMTDGMSRFTGAAHPILSLASQSLSTGAAYKSGNWKFGARAFSGAITDESLLENDPTISAQYAPARLGRASGLASDIEWTNGKFAFGAGIGTMNESDTLLGAASDGLLNMGAGDTVYVDSIARYMPADDVNLSLRATFARTASDASGEFVMGLTDISSNAFSVGADVGNWSFAAALPLAVTSGAMRYAHAEYETTESDTGDFYLDITDARIANLDLSPDVREVRFSGAYRHKFGEFTDGAFGFIYRVNPNHTQTFGDEAILMMKLSHRIGI